MTTIVYTALRELTGVNLVDSTTTFDIGISEYSRSRNVVKDSPQAKGGARETLYHRTDKNHSITFQPVNGFERKQLDEFLASTESGETFQIYIYGLDASPLSVYRTDDGNESSSFMNVGTSDKDYWQSSITVCEV